MAQGKPRDERKERQWLQWIGAWRASQLGVRAFCTRHGLDENRFYVWRRVLSQRAADRTAFVPVQVVPDEAPASALEVVLSNGRTVRVAAGFDAATLRELVTVLEEGRPC
jgi:transposase-like protein